jgi:hypothetical protein
MTEQEQIEAIDALAGILYWMSKGKSCPPQEQESVRHSTAQALRTLHEGNHLNAQDVCEFLVMQKWIDATEQDKLICAWAVAAMEEIIQSEQ